MSSMTTSRNHLFAMTLFMLAVAVAAADPARPATPDPTESASVQGFGEEHKACIEWSDGCITCRRDLDAKAHCSTPGIACQPQETSCKEPRP